MAQNRINRENEARETFANGHGSAPRYYLTYATTGICVSLGSCSYAGQVDAPTYPQNCAKVGSL